ncbi:hypothetical protein [Rhodococcus oxybenzonivorans]|nr:hypothetical protein [Rhodococcus oxybenzonivorans]
MTTDAASLMDDPKLSRDYKEQLLQAWASSREEDVALWQPYFDAYGIDRRERTPSADERYIALLADGSDARSAAADRLHLEDCLRPDSLNVPGDMLDLGARGLEFFEMFLPAAQKLQYDGRAITEYYARFDAERGMDLHVLGRDIDTLQHTLDSARRELEEHEACVAAVSAAWSGDAAAAAIDASGRRNARTVADVDRLRGLVDVLFEANLTLSAAVTDKAYRVVSLHQPTVAGYSAAQIAVLADIAVHGRDGDNSVAKDCMEDASYWFPELADDDYRHINGLYKDGGGGALRWLDRDDVVKRAAGIARAWLDAHFRPVYEEKQREFAAACEACADTVEASYAAVITEAGMLQSDSDIRSVDRTAPGHSPAPPPLDAPRTPVDAAPTAPAGAPTVTAPVGFAGQPAGWSSPTGTTPSGTAHPAPVTAPMTAPIGPGNGGRDLGVRDVGVGTRDVHTEPATSLPAASPPVLPSLGGVPGLAGVPGIGGMTGFGDLRGAVQGLAGGLGDLGSLIRPLIEDAVSALTRRDDDGDVGAEEEPDLEDERDPGVDGEGGQALPTTPDKSLELKLDGKSWTLVVDEDGAGVHLDIIDGQGATSRFGVEIGPNGLPQIFAETRSGEDPLHQAAAAPEPASGTDAPQTGAVDAKPPAAPDVSQPEPHEAEQAPPEPTTAPGPQPVTMQNEPLPETLTVPEPAPAPELASGPSATLDSGAELAEAGPL